MVLEPGEAPPGPTAPNQHGQPTTPDREGPTVLFFYPEDGTPGCEIETEQFGLEAESFEDAGVSVYGVSVDDVDSHRAFAEEMGVEFDLLADPDGELLSAYDVGRDDRGRARRTTVVLLDGEVHRVYENVTPDGHARRVLEDLLEDGIVKL